MNTMKIILTGSSGFVGQEVLNQALAHPSITSIIALSRKPLTALVTSNPKLETILMDDFSDYSPEVFSKLKDAEACVWCIGAKSPNVDVTRKVSLEYTLAAAEAFSKLPQKNGMKFRFVFTSGVLAEKDATKSLWLFPAARRVAGEVETALIDFARTKSTIFESYIMRPAGILSKEFTLKNLGYQIAMLRTNRVDHLAASMLAVAINGSEIQTWECPELTKRGREILKK